MTARSPARPRKPHPGHNHPNEPQTPPEGPSAVHAQGIQAYALNHHNNQRKNIMTMDKETCSNILDALALYRCFSEDREGYVIAVADASPESLQGIVTGAMVLAKMIAARPADMTVPQFLDRWEFELQRELDKGPGE